MLQIYVSYQLNSLTILTLGNEPFLEKELSDVLHLWYRSAPKPFHVRGRKEA